MSGSRHVHIHVTGIVQGVGMRPFVYREAMAHGICGSVLNAGDGVHIDAVAAPDDIDAFVRDLAAHAPAAARVEHIEVRDGDPDADICPGFRIIASDGSGRRTTLVSPDIATCDDCLRELFDPADRRFHYPFINCTNCGPRFTIIKSLPYDRPATSMSDFPMCPACAHEYADPGDRRFHAQPDACFECGPHITWREHDAEGIRYGRDLQTSDAIIERCCELIAAGGIVAIKGLGGFHLCCNAADERAVTELRRRKHRGNKPLAIMVATLQEARELCEVDDAEANVLSGTVRPIVLLRRHAACSPDALAPSVAHRLPELGVMLPYTPLQHLLLAAAARVGIHALVMTSGNISAEPIETDDETAWVRLGGIADALLGNGRAILSRYDDSVVRIWRGRILPVRRARGFAPNPLPLPGEDAPSVLACGPEQKATLAITRAADGTIQCFVSQHIGDVENASTFSAWHDARHRFEQLFDLHPQALACDAHPTYLTSQWARSERERTGAPLIEVQHHHAHIASVIAEAACTGAHDAAAPVIGVAFDGTGAGGDGTVWGGEFLVATLAGYTRAAHLACWRLPGAAASIRDARRCVLGLLTATGMLEHPGAAPMLARLSEHERSVTETMIARAINSPLTSSAGRLLDACAALLGICDVATYDGEPAIMLEAAAHTAAARNVCSPVQLTLRRPDDGTATPLVLEPGPLIERLLDGIAHKEDTGALAHLVHASLAQAICDTVQEISRTTGIRTAALSGGVFMNRLLLERTVELLERAGMTVLVPRTVPVNDGCIAYGQAAVASARLAAPRQDST